MNEIQWWLFDRARSHVIQDSAGLIVHRDKRFPVLQIATEFLQISRLVITLSLHKFSPDSFKTDTFWDLQFCFVCVLPSADVQRVLWLLLLWRSVWPMRRRQQFLTVVGTEGWYLVSKNFVGAFCTKQSVPSIPFIWHSMCSVIGVISDWHLISSCVKASMNLLYSLSVFTLFKSNESTFAFWMVSKMASSIRLINVVFAPSLSAF